MKSFWTIGVLALLLSVTQAADASTVTASMTGKVDSTWGVYDNAFGPIGPKIGDDIVASFSLSFDTAINAPGTTDTSLATSHFSINGYEVELAGTGSFLTGGQVAGINVLDSVLSMSVFGSPSMVASFWYSPDVGDQPRMRDFVVFSSTDFGFRVLDPSDITVTVTGVPELSTWAMLVAGFAGIGVFSSGRRRQLNSAAEGIRRIAKSADRA